MGYYDIAQICLNGHVVNHSTRTNRVHSSSRCKRCGMETITACPSCNQNIRGEYHVEGVFAVSGYEAPPFCDSCGAAFPWTESKLEASHELVEELGLDIPEKTLLTESIQELVRDTPKAQTAAVRFSRLTQRAKPVVMEGFRQVLYNVLSEPVRKLIWP